MTCERCGREKHAENDGDRGLCDACRQAARPAVEVNAAHRWWQESAQRATLATAGAPRVDALKESSALVRDQDRRIRALERAVHDLVQSTPGLPSGIDCPCGCGRTS